MMPTQRNGLYEIFTVFVFLVVLLLVLFLALLLSGNVTLLKGHTSEARLKTSLAREAYTVISRCNGQQVFDEARIEQCRTQASGQMVRAVRVTQEDTDACPARIWGEAEYELATRDTGTSAFPYWISVKQEGESVVCLAQMVIVI